MGDVVQLFGAQPEREEEPTCSGEAVCMDCEHRWVAVVPQGTKWFECPNCHACKGHMEFRFGREEDHWTCNCGNNLFCIISTGIYCPACGHWQRPF